MKLYVLRHGETLESKECIMQGNMETYLDEYGKEQALSRREIIKEKGINLVISSPKARTLETAKLAAPGIELITDARLLSRNHGEFQGKRRDEVDIKEYWNIKKNVQYEQAESVCDLFNRVSSFLNMVSIKYSDKKVLLVTHSGICRVLYYYFNGFPEDGDLTEYESTTASFEEYEL